MSLTLESSAGFHSVWGVKTTAALAMFVCLGVGNIAYLWPFVSAAGFYSVVAAASLTVVGNGMILSASCWPGLDG